MGHIRDTNNKWVGFRLVNIDTFIRVEFGLANIDTIRTLTRHEHDSSTRIATPNCHAWYLGAEVRGQCEHWGDT